MLLKVAYLKINYTTDGKSSAIPTKMFYEYLDEYEDEFGSVYLEINFENRNIQSRVESSLEMAIKSLEYNLPDSMSIACCRSCRYGNFNPFGDLENEIFCLKGEKIRDKCDMVDLVSRSNLFNDQKDGFNLLVRKRPLLYFCEDFELITPDEKYYVYNDWGYTYKKGKKSGNDEHK